MTSFERSAETLEWKGGDDFDFDDTGVFVDEELEEKGGDDFDFDNVGCFDDADETNGEAGRRMRP